MISCSERFLSFGDAVVNGYKEDQDLTRAQGPGLGRKEPLADVIEIIGNYSEKHSRVVCL